MTAGRLKMLGAGETGPKTPAFALEFEGGSKLVLTENARKKRAGVWLLTPEAAAAELAHLGPEALGLDAAALAEILRREAHRLHPLLRDQRAIAGIGRAWANEILHTAKLSPYALSTDLSDDEVARLATAMNEELARGLELRERGASDDTTYRVHNRLGQPCHVCGTPIAQIDFEEHTIYYCPAVPDRRPRAQGPADVPPAPIAISSARGDRRRRDGEGRAHGRAVELDRRGGREDGRGERRRGRRRRGLRPDRRDHHRARPAPRRRVARPRGRGARARSG